MTSATAVTGVVRNKDGVPAWDGNCSTYQEYEEICLLWQESTEYHKRYMNGPKLAGELTGPAKRLILGKPSGWLSHPNGVHTLLEYLRSCLGRPQISELSDFLTRYFRHGRRKAGESMSDYVTRKCEMYLRAQQALQRVRPHHGSGDNSYATHEEPHGGIRDQGRRSSWDSTTSQMTNDSNPAAPVAAAASNAADNDAEETNNEPRDPWSWNNTGQGWNWWDTGSSWSWGYGSSWWQDAWESRYPAQRWKTAPKVPLLEILPDFVQAWYMLQDSGLDVHDRNMIQTAVGSDFTLQRVSQELRTQWPDHELKKRDQGHRHSSYWGETQMESEEDGDSETYDRGYWLEHGMNEEGLAAMDAAEDDIQGAMAAIQSAKRTLKEARAKQKFVKLSRKYYQGSGATGGQRGHAPDDSKMTCLKCGRVGHRAANCPEKKDKPETQHAPFVCFGDVDIAWANGTSKTTEEAISEGMAIIDGGATKTLGSIAAVESLMAKNREHRGHDGVKGIDPDNRPVFSFGNSSRNRCASTVQMLLEAAGKPGQLQIHTLEEGQGPILLSVDTLRTLKAVIDFEHDVLVFRALDDKKLIPVERSATGHQLLPLSTDLYKNAWTTSKAVPSLLAFREPTAAE